VELFNLRQLESLDLSGGTAVGSWELGLFRGIFPGDGSSLAALDYRRVPGKKMDSK
jgi:hypothetical protein